MRLSSFINEHISEILREWESFAKTIEPAAENMSALALRDHAREILQTIALDIESWQSEEKRYEKSHGMAPVNQRVPSAASLHGALRQASNFSLVQLNAEYRALRATVLRLWLPQITKMSSATVYEMVRFNEAIDQAMAESVLTYSARADETRDLYLTILGHDLMAPLSSITLACNALTQPTLTPQEDMQISTRIRRNVRMMRSLVDNLLGYTRLQLGRGMPMMRQDADINAICEAAIADAKSSQPGSQFTLQTTGNLQGDLDGPQLSQLVMNLLVNAAHNGATDAPVVMAVQGDPDAITIQVTNFGPAIPEALLPTIFKPVIQLATGDDVDKRSQTSLGLGLFIVREIALAHGGTIAVKSNEADGTTFTVRLPRKASN